MNTNCINSFGPSPFGKFRKQLKVQHFSKLSFRIVLRHRAIGVQPTSRHIGANWGKNGRITEEEPESLNWEKNGRKTEEEPEILNRKYLGRRIVSIPQLK